MPIALRGALLGVFPLATQAVRYGFHPPLLDHHQTMKGQTTWYETLEEMQADLDTYLATCSQRRLHRGQRREGRTPYQVLTQASRSPSRPERGAQDEGSLDIAPARAECQVKANYSESEQRSTKVQ